MNGLIRWLGLVAAATLFLWMFLSVAALESAASGTGAAALPPEVRQSAQRFVADWRHGMAGNSPIYMPGFFALACAAWYWTASQSRARLAIEGLAALVIGGGLAWLAAPLGQSAAMNAFDRRFEMGIEGDAAGWRTALVGAGTAVCWTIFVLASRLALTRRTWRPFLLVPIPYLVLAFSRQWSVDRLLAVWAGRAANGDVVAIGSALAVPILAAVLVRTAKTHARRHGAQYRDIAIDPRSG